MFEFWVGGKPLCCFCVYGKMHQYKWDLSFIVNWLMENRQYIMHEMDFPLDVDAKTSIDFWNKSGEFDSEDIEEFHEWYEKRQDWYFRHSWYSYCAESYLAEIFFRRVEDLIEIEWDNTNLYEDVIFLNPKGIYYVDAFQFKKVIDEFIQEFKGFV